MGQRCYSLLDDGHRPIQAAKGGEIAKMAREAKLLTSAEIEFVQNPPPRGRFPGYVLDKEVLEALSARAGEWGLIARAETTQKASSIRQSLSTRYADLGYEFTQRKLEVWGRQAERLAA